MTLSQLALQERGFVGFIRLSEIGHQSDGLLPVAPGVYVLVCDWDDEPRFLDRSTGGHFKGRDPTVATKVLGEKWVSAAHVLYIGKATNLRSRVSQLLRFGAGRRTAHWGGRFLWQLEDAWELSLCWKVRSDAVAARALEQSLMAAFQQDHFALPFANLRT